jgi:predicted dehydrogenase
MKYMFIGLGSIGQRHLQNLRNITDDPIIAYRTKTDNVKEFDEKYNIKSYTDLDQALEEKPDVVFITNPTNLHMPIALQVADNKSHIFIEKPISHDSEKVDELFTKMKENQKTCFVGFNFRFHPSLIRVKRLITEGRIGKILFARIQVGEYLPDWHPNKDYRNEYSARKDQGGGVILTLVHEIDYAYWLFGEIKSVMAFAEKISPLEIDVEDVASIIMKTKGNAIIELHMDYIQKPPTRVSEIVGTKGKIIWDYFANEIKIYENKTKKWTTIEEKDFERNQMYEEELKHFLNCVNGKEKPKISNKDVKDVMKVVEAIKKSATEGKRINL